MSEQLHDRDGRDEVHGDQGPLAEPDLQVTEYDQVQPEDATYDDPDTDDPDTDDPLSLGSTREDETRSHPGG
jgi:hypothetical protein